MIRSGKFVFMFCLFLPTVVRGQTIDQLQQQVNDYRDQQDYAAAVPLAKRVWEMSISAYGAKHPKTLSAHYRYGRYLVMNDEYEAARPVYVNCLTLQREVLGEMHDDTHTTYDQLVILLDDLGDYETAIAYQERDLYFQRKKLGLQHEDVGWLLNRLGGLYKDAGEYEKAREAYQEALQLFQRLPGNHGLSIAIVQSNFGLNLYETGDYAKATAMLEQVVPVFRRELGEDHPYMATAYQNLGYMIQLQGDGKKARPYYERALSLRLKLFGEDDINTAYMYNNLALSLDEEGEDEAALPYFEKAFAIFTQVKGEAHPDTATIQSCLGDLHADLGNDEEAQHHLTQALEKCRTALGENHSMTETVLGKLGSFHYMRGNYAEAREFYEQNYAAALQALGPDHPDTTDAQLWLAVIDAAEGKWDESIERADSAFRSIHQHVRHILLGQTPEEQLNYLKLQTADWQRGLSYVLARPEDQDVIETTAGWLINQKGLAQETLAARELLSRDLADSAARELTTQLTDIRQQLASLVISQVDRDQAEDHQQRIEQLKAQERALSRQVTQELGDSAEGLEWVELAAIREAIPEGEMLINFARFAAYDFEAEPGTGKWDAARYGAWIFPSAGSGPICFIDLGSADEMDALVESVRKVVTEAGKPNGSIKQSGERAAEQEFRAAALPLARKLWQPIAEKLPEGTQRLILCPDAALWLLPWSAIPTDRDRYLIDQYAIRYLISGRELVVPDSASATTPPLLFADPDFDLPPEKVWQAVRSIFHNIELDPNASRGLVSRTAVSRVPALPNTRIEALAIAPSVEQITGKTAVRYLGKYALESVVKRVKRPEVMVLSTHGFFLPDQEIPQGTTEVLTVDNRSAALLSTQGTPVENPLLRCGLLLAGCNQPAIAGDDGILTGMEIVSLDLRGTELVVLSACETGIGKIQTGEGVSGLRQAFQLAGAKGVVSTLWQVPDRDSAILMQDFFRALAEEQQQSDSLRAAQLSRIKSRRERYGAAHPYFWAAWTVTKK